MKIKVICKTSLYLLISLSNFSSCKGETEQPMVVLETISATEITQSSAKSGGKILSNNGVDIKEKGVCWSESPNPETDNSKTNDGGGNDNFESLLTNLESNKTYYIRAYAKNVGVYYGDEKSFTTSSSYSTGQIVADHSIIDDFEKIPVSYLAEVKKMMVWFPGESHSYAYRDGLEILETTFPEFDCNVQWGFEAFTSSHLRVAGWPTEGLGEQDWYTWKAYPSGSIPPAGSTIKNYISTNSLAGKTISLIGFAWCYDMVHMNGPTASADPELGVHWYGTSVGGPDGNMAWGINSADYMQTKNKVSLDTYLAAMEDYILYCTTNGYKTKVAFTTHPVDKYTGEGGYQAFLKNEAIRKYVAMNSERILFDYADILCYDDNGNPSTTNWNGHNYPTITPKNLGNEETGHIGPAGAIRLAKAQWWLLARLAGWDGK